MAKLYPPLLEASIPAFFGETVIIPFKHNPLVSTKDYVGIKVQVKKVSGELVGVYPGTIIKETNNNDYVVSCSLKYEDLYKDYTKTKNLKLVLPNWYKFQIAYTSGAETGYYSTAAVGRFLGPIKPEVTLQVSSNSCKAVYSHPNDPAEKAYSYRFILKRIASEGYEEKIIEDTDEQIHNINEDGKADESIDTFNFIYNIAPEEGAIYELFYTLTTINGFVISKTVPIEQINLSGIALTSIQEKDMFEIEAICNRDNASVELWAYPNDTLNTITGWFKVWRTSSKDNHLRIRLVTTFALVNTRTRYNEEQIKILLGVDKTVEAGYYYRYYIQQYNQYGICSQVISRMKNNKAVYVSFDDCFLWDGERQLRIKFNPKISSFKTNILQSKTETIGSKYPFITRNGVVNYKEFPISGLISLLMDENEQFMTEEEKEQLGVLPENTFRPCTPSNGGISTRDEDGAFKRHLRKNLERETPQNLVDININGEKDFKLAVLNFLNSNKPKLFRSATEGTYVVYTMNSSLTPNDTLGRMLHTFNCTAYECEAVEDFCNRYINDKIYCYSSRNEFLNLIDLSNLELYAKTRQVPYLTQDIVSEGNEAIFDSLIDQRLLDIDEYARGFFIRDAKPLQEFKVSFINIFQPEKDIPDQKITIGATGSYNYFCTDANIYIKYIWPIIKKNEIIYDNPSVIIFREVFRIPITDFDFLNKSFSYSQLATILKPKKSAYSNSEQVWRNTLITGRISNSKLDTLLEEFRSVRPISMYASSCFDNSKGTFKRMENNLEYIYLLRVFNQDPIYHHTAAYTLGNGFKIYEELGRIFTYNFKKQENLSQLLRTLFDNCRSFNIEDREKAQEIENRLNLNFCVSKNFYLFCKKMKIGRLKGTNPILTSIFTLEQMKIEDRVKHMSKTENKNFFVFYNLKIDYESLRLYYDNISTTDTFVRALIKRIQEVLINMLENIKSHRTTRLITPNGTMVLAVELPSIMDFCIWENHQSSKDVLNDQLLYEISVQSRSNEYDFSDIKSVWEVYIEDAI